ncbi:MAG: hypothetical protein ACR2H3_07265 [Acidimicrobiales bacterium]
MARIAEISLGDLLRTARRYRPVGVVILVVLLAAWILPNAPRDKQVETAFAPEASKPTGRPAPTTTAPEAPFEVPGFTPPAVASTPPVAGPTFGGGTTFGGGSGFTTATTEPFAGPTTTTTSPPRPLRTIVTGWASATGGTAVGSTGVPAQSLPVGTRFSQTDKASFVRLAGTATTLYLKENPDGSRTTQGAPAVRACQITTRDWKAAENATFDQSPKWDSAQCVAGQRRTDGVWSFDLSGLPGVTDNRGVALIPGASSPVDFQVAFQQQTVDG